MNDVRGKECITASFECSEISDDLIPFGASLVFDWDNTLKLYDPGTRSISSRVPTTTLTWWKSHKRCQMYIISAIRPSRINLETLLLEVGKLDLTEMFTCDSDQVIVEPGIFARKGNIIICGYDKAETFLAVTSRNKREQEGKTGVDETNCIHNVDMVDGLVPKNIVSFHIKEADVLRETDNVVFFDDEEVNIINFRQIVRNSKCYLVK